MAFKRSIYLINPKFQLKFSLFVCSLVFLSSLVYPLTIYELIESLVAQSNSEVIASALTRNRMKLILVLGLFQTGFTALVFVICIFQSHKIAGPMYKLKKFLQSIKDGNPPTKLFFRKGDNFQEIAEAFNEAFSTVQENHLRDFTYLSEINSYINNLSHVIPEDKKAVISEISNKLNEIQDRFKV